MTDLSTTYLGLKLKNPIVASASPLSKKIERARKLEEAGIAAIVMYSLKKALSLITTFRVAQIPTLKPYRICQMAVCMGLARKNI